MIAVLVNTLLVGLVALLLWLEHFQWGYLVAIACIFGIADAFLYPAILSLLPKIVDPAMLVQANSLMQGGEQITNVLGPALAGMAIASLGLPFAFLLNTLLFAGGCLGLLLVMLSYALGLGTAGLGMIYIANG